MASGVPVVIRDIPDAYKNHGACVCVQESAIEESPARLTLIDNAVHITDITQYKHS